MSSISFEILTNIKTDEISFEEETEGIEDEVNTDEPIVETLEDEEIEDPLKENTRKQDFLWQYTEEDFYNNEPAVAAEQQSTRSKRARIVTDYKGRNGHKWSSTIPSAFESFLSTDAIQVPKGKGPARLVSNPLEAWNLLLDEPILSKIVKLTNEEIRSRKGRSSYQRTVDLVEFRSWLGLNYLCGLFRNSLNNGPLEELWTIELGNAIFRATMSVKRFEFIMECLRFHEKTKQPSEHGKMELVRQMWEKFLINCRSYYSPSGNCTIDEHILSTTDTSCPHQQTLPKNTQEYGLRLVTLCDAKTLYMCNAIVTTDSNHMEREVLHLVCDMKGTNRNICLNERYTTLTLANKLLQHKMSLVGALEASDKVIPTEFVSPVKIETQTLYAGSSTLTCGQNPSYILTNGISAQINSQKLYSLTSQACQHHQLLADAYSTSFAMPAREASWPLDFFHNMLNYAAVNAWILLRLSNNGDATLLQRDFMRQLGLYLTQQQLKRRLQRNEKLPVIQKLQISEILGEPTDKLLSEAKTVATTAVSAGTLLPEKATVPDGIQLLSKMTEKRSRCRKCPGKMSVKTRSRCQQCLRALCHRHLILRCDDCSGVILPTTETEINDNGILEDMPK